MEVIAGWNITIHEPELTEKDFRTGLVEGRGKLMQETYCLDPWRMLVGCIMLNQTTNKQMWPVIRKFFRKFPHPSSVKQSSYNEIREMTRSLGFSNKRSQTIITFSHEWVNKDWDRITDLHGIGKYASDSYEIFVKGNRRVNPTDKVLLKYLSVTRRSQCHHSKQE